MDPDVGRVQHRSSPLVLYHREDQVPCFHVQEGWEHLQHTDILLSPPGPAASAGQLSVIAQASVLGAQGWNSSYEPSLLSLLAAAQEHVSGGFGMACLASGHLLGTSQCLPIQS